MHLILFIVFAGFCLAGAINLLLQSHPISSALSLIVVMVSLAVLYLLLGAEFLAAAQVIVYAGAIMVLFTFVVMLLNAGREEHTLGSRHPGRRCPGQPWRRRKDRPEVNSLLSQEVPLSWYLLLSTVLFSLGVVGFLIKRNLITVFMSIELMLNAVNLSFVTFAHQWHAVKGQIFVFFVMMVAAAEAAVGLAIIIAVFRARATLAVDRIDLMKL